MGFWDSFATVAVVIEHLLLSSGSLTARCHMGLGLSAGYSMSQIVVTI